MRTPRPGSRWSRARLARRSLYTVYMDSPAWAARRRDWYAGWLTMHGIPPTCAVCDRPWSLRTGHLHHATYDRLSQEADADLVPLCRRHHEQLHSLLDSSPTWRRLGRPAATAGIIGVLRSQLCAHDATRP